MSNTAKTPDRTLEQAEAELTQAKATISSQADQIGGLTGEKAQLTAQVERGQASLSEATSIIDDQAEQISGLEAEKAELAAENAKLRATPATYPTITVEGVSYQVTAPSFQYKKQTYTLAELLADEALQAELVAKGMGFLEVVEPSTAN